MRTVYGDLFLTKRQYIKVWAEWAETTRDNAECWGWAVPPLGQRQRERLKLRRGRKFCPETCLESI